MVRSKIKIYKKGVYAPPKKKVPVEKQSSTPLIWYGGKSRDAQSIIAQFPPHNTYVEVFGGGGAVLMAKDTSVIDVYNDIGEVSNFYKVLRDHGEELYDALYLTPYSREEFEICKETLKMFAQMRNDGTTIESKEELVEWARCFYIRVMQSFTHEQQAATWKNSKTMDLANNWNNHIEDLPRFVERLRKVVIEKLDFMKLLKMYDAPHTLFYIDPPYVEDTRASVNNYVHEMPFDRHKELLTWLTKDMRGQAIVSMYAHDLYDSYLKDWRRVTINHVSMIHNSNSKANNTRTEVLWVREHLYGLWSYQSDIEQANLAGMEMEET